MPDQRKEVNLGEVNRMRGRGVYDQLHFVFFTNHWEVCQQHWDVRLLLATDAWKFGEFTKYDH